MGSRHFVIESLVLVSYINFPDESSLLADEDLVKVGALLGKELYFDYFILLPVEVAVVRHREGDALGYALF